MRLTWHHGFLDPMEGQVEVDGSREAIARQIERVFPQLRVDAQRLEFVPLGDGRRTQVNLHAFGPFGILER